MFSRSRPRISLPPSPQKFRHDGKAVGVHFDDGGVAAARWSAIDRWVSSSISIVMTRRSRSSPRCKKSITGAWKLTAKGSKNATVFVGFFCPKFTACQVGACSRYLRCFLTGRLSPLLRAEFLSRPRLGGSIPAASVTILLLDAFALEGALRSACIWLEFREPTAYLQNDVLDHFDFCRRAAPNKGRHAFLCALAFEQLLIQPRQRHDLPPTKLQCENFFALRGLVRTFTRQARSLAGLGDRTGPPIGARLAPGLSAWWFSSRPSFAKTPVLRLPHLRDLSGEPSSTVAIKRFPL